MLSNSHLHHSLTPSQIHMCVYAKKEREGVQAGGPVIQAYVSYSVM